MNISSQKKQDTWLILHFFDAQRELMLLLCREIQGQFRYFTPRKNLWAPTLDLLVSHLLYHPWPNQLWLLQVMPAYLRVLNPQCTWPPSCNRVPPTRMPKSKNNRIHGPTLTGLLVVSGGLVSISLWFSLFKDFRSRKDSGNRTLMDAETQLHLYTIFLCIHGTIFLFQQSFFIKFDWHIFSPKKHTLPFSESVSSVWCTCTQFICCSIFTGNAVRLIIEP